MKDKKYFIDFSELRIISANKTQIFVVGKSYEDYTNEQSCILQIKKPDYNKMFKLWLNEKADAVKRYSNFVAGSSLGVECNVEHLGCMEIHDLLLGGDYKKDEDNTSNVDVLSVVSWETEFHMEHG